MMIDALRNRLTTRSARRADEALKAGDRSEQEIDRIASETHAGAARLRKALTKLEVALQQGRVQ